jgi:hypothetical protein
MAYMDGRDNPEPARVRTLFESLLEDDSFPRAGVTLAANQVLLTDEADQALAGLLAQAEQNGDSDRAVAISQLRAFVGRCRRTGLIAVFPPDHPDIDPAVVSAVGADMRAADKAEESYDRTGDINALTAAATAWRRVMAHPGLASAYPGLRAALLNNGGGVLLRRYWAVGRQEDLSDTLEALRIAVALTPPHSHLVVGRLCNLGLAIREVYRQSSDDRALERAIGAFEMAAQVAAAQPQSAPTARPRSARRTLTTSQQHLATGNANPAGRGRLRLRPRRRPAGGGTGDRKVPGGLVVSGAGRSRSDGPTGSGRTLPPGGRGPRAARSELVSPGQIPVMCRFRGKAASGRICERIPCRSRLAMEAGIPGGEFGAGHDRRWEP